MISLCGSKIVFHLDRILEKQTRTFPSKKSASKKAIKSAPFNLIFLQFSNGDETQRPQKGAFQWRVCKFKTEFGSDVPEYLVAGIQIEIWGAVVWNYFFVLDYHTTQRYLIQSILFPLRCRNFFFLNKILFFTWIISKFTHPFMIFKFY